MIVMNDLFWEGDFDYLATGGYGFYVNWKRSATAESSRVTKQAVAESDPLKKYQGL
jgi:hypothetical protein